MIALRRVESEADADVFLALRRAIDPEHMPARMAYLEHIKAPGRVDVLAELDGEPVGAAFVERHGDDPAGPEGWMSVRVLREFRRRGVGTALFRAVSEHARADGRTALTMSAQEDDADSRSYLGKRGFVEVVRMQESTLDLGLPPIRSRHPRGSSSSYSARSSSPPSTRRRSRSLATSRLRMRSGLARSRSGAPMTCPRSHAANAALPPWPVAR